MDKTNNAVARRRDETRRITTVDACRGVGRGAMRGSAPAPLQGRRPAAWRGFGTAPTRLRLRLRGDDEVEPPSAPTRDPGNATAASGRGKGRGTLVPAACRLRDRVDRSGLGWLAGLVIKDGGLIITVSPPLSCVSRSRMVQALSGYGGQKWPLSAHVIIYNNNNT